MYVCVEYVHSLIAWKLYVGVRPLRQGFCDDSDSSISHHRFPISYRLGRKKKKKKKKKNKNSSPQEWAPLSYPNHLRWPEQSHNYSTTTKSNPQNFVKQSASLFPNYCHHCFHPFLLERRTTRRRKNGKGKGANKPLSNCFYGGAFPHCLTAIQPILPSSLERETENVKLGRTSGDFLPKLVIKSRLISALVCELWMRFFERGVGEEKKKKKKKKKKGK